MEKLPSEIHLLINETKHLDNLLSTTSDPMEKEMIKQNLKTNFDKIHQKLINMKKMTETSQEPEDKRKIEEYTMEFEKLKEKLKTEGIEISQYTIPKGMEEKIENKGEKPITEEEMDRMHCKGKRQQIKRTFGAKFIDPELQKKRLEKMEKKKNIKERLRCGAAKTKSKVLETAKKGIGFLKDALGKVQEKL